MDIQELRRLSAKTELSLNFIAKDLMLSKALLGLQNKNSMSKGDVDNGNVNNDDIILKGGTAINRMYLKNKEKMRFSEDIDFDIISAKNVKETIPRTKEIMKNLKGFEKTLTWIHALTNQKFFINEKINYNNQELINMSFRTNETKEEIEVLKKIAGETGEIIKKMREKRKMEDAKSTFEIRKQIRQNRTDGNKKYLHTAKK